MARERFDLKVRFVELTAVVASTIEHFDLFLLYSRKRYVLKSNSFLLFRLLSHAFSTRDRCCSRTQCCLLLMLIAVNFK